MSLLLFVMVLVIIFVREYKTFLYLKKKKGTYQEGDNSTGDRNETIIKSKSTKTMAKFFDIMLFLLGETMDSHVYYNISIPKIKKCGII